MSVESVKAKAITEKAALNQFVEYTSSASFVLTLTKRQITFLIDLHDCGQGLMHARYNHFIASLNGCERRGLVGRKVIHEGRSFSGGRGWRYEFFVTEAGKHVVALLKMVGHQGELSASKANEVRA